MINIDGINYEINRDNAKVTNFDKDYCNLLKDILKNGEYVENRTGINTFSIPNVVLNFDLKKEFPILESKKINIQNAITELLWIYQAQSNDVNWLKERENNIWNEWQIDEEGYWNATQNVPDGKGGFKKEEVKKYFGKEYAGTIGTAYGWIVNRYKKPQEILYKLKNNPTDRRMVMSLWQDEYIKTAVLPSCVWSSEFKVYKGTLNMFVHQRSADVPLGLPFNVSQYAVLLSLFAKVSNLDLGKMSFSISDAHIYENQLEGINLQLYRFDIMKELEKIIKKCSDIELQQFYDNISINLKYDMYKKESIQKKLQETKMLFELMVTKEKPYLYLANKDDFFAFDNKKDNDDIKVLNYKSAPFIKMPVAK